MSSRINEWIEASLLEHQQMMSVQTDLQRIANESAEENQTEPVCCALREKAAAVSMSILRLFEREQQTLFPMLRPLADQTTISPCRAGMFGAWVRQIRSSVRARLAK